MYPNNATYYCYIISSERLLYNCYDLAVIQFWDLQKAVRQIHIPWLKLYVQVFWKVLRERTAFFLGTEMQKCMGLFMYVAIYIKFAVIIFSSFNLLWKGDTIVVV